MASNTLLTGFYFCVRIAGNSSANDAAFQEANGLGKEMQTEDVISGGENRFKYRLPNGVSYQNLVLKRGIVVDDSPLVEWCQTTLDGGSGKPIQLKNISVFLLNQNGQTCMSWNFVNAYPLKWTISDLKSQENSLMIETIEFAYHYFDLDDGRDNQYAGIADLFA